MGLFKKKRKGAVESISFLLLLPAFVISFVFLIYVMQTALTAQALSYTTYCATRAAVVSETEEQARENANAVTQKCLPSGYMNISNARWDFTTEDGEESVWVKGKLIRGTVRLNTTLMLPFGGLGNREMSSSVVCMVERPAT